MLVDSYVFYVSYSCGDRCVRPIFFFIGYGDHRDLHLLSRRQRQMCIRDSLRAAVDRLQHLFIEILHAEAEAIETRLRQRLPRLFIQIPE